MKRDLSYLAILGIATGLLVSSEAQSEDLQEINSFDMQHLIAKPACKGANGCGGLTAYDDKHDADHHHDDDDDQTYDDDDDIPPAKPASSVNKSNKK